jgi:dTMP kinase
MNKTIKKGLFISIEGIEGAGKSTACHFIKDHLNKHHIDVVMTREPGGTEIAEQIRNVLLAHHDEVMMPQTEALLMCASREQHVTTKIKPALQRGDWVVSDRFSDASYAYQGGARQLGVEKVMELQRWAIGDFCPNFTFLLDVPLNVSLQRVAKRKKLDRIELEQAAFFETVRNTYLDLAKRFPDRYRVIDSTLEKKQVQQQLKENLNDMMLYWQKELAQ